jgi:outer membrane protein assembly complex protein YaeT
MFFFAGSLPAADLHVRGISWFQNRKAEQRLKILLGGQHGETLDAAALEDAALVLFGTVTDDGSLEPAITVEFTGADGQPVAHALNPQLDQPLPRPLSVKEATLRIVRGHRFALREVRFSGLRAMTEKEARAFFVGENTLINIASERLYSPGRLQKSMGNLEEALRQQGYAEAAVTSAPVEIDHATGAVRARIIVQEGRRWQVTALTFAIADGSAAPKNLTTLRPGQPWNSLWRQETTTVIRRWYYQRGHADVQVKLNPQAADAADGTKAVTVVAQVTPGREIRVGAVHFTGNRYTREQTLRRLVRSKPGDLLNPIQFDNSQARISRLGVFRQVTLNYDPPDAETRDVLYNVTEGRRQEVSLLAGYGSYEQLRGGVEWRHYNLFGRAHTDSLKLIQSMKSTSADYVYTVPSLFGSTVDGSTQLFGLRREEFSFDREEYGASVSALIPLRGLGVALTTGYTFKHVRASDNELATSATDSTEADIGSVNVGIVRERRDNPLRPHKGYHLRLQLESAGRELGSEVVYQQLVFGGSYHTSWGEGRWLHVGLSQGLVTTLGAAKNEVLPVSVLFFPGGDGSIRGYQEGAAAPRDAAGLFIGAKAYTQFNLELEQALTSKWSAVVFFDALGTAARLADFPWQEKLYSAGIGVRYQTVIGPVRLEYGHNLNPRPRDPSGTVLLSIGFPF